MSTIHYIFTRFSILDKTCKGFQLTRNNIDNIENLLFNENRLNYKFNVFHNMTVPSIKNQTYQNYVWLIFTSNYLPQKYKNILEKYSCDKIKIVYVENFNEMSEYIKNTLKNIDHYTTMRLDDDDALSRTFLEEINKYENEKGKIISFPNGINYTFTKNKFILGSRISHKHIALGLTAIGFNIFRAGDHSKLDQKNIQVIEIPTKDSYFLCCSDYCDTKRKFN